MCVCVCVCVFALVFETLTVISTRDNKKRQNACVRESENSINHISGTPSRISYKNDEFYEYLRVIGK